MSKCSNIDLLVYLVSETKLNTKYCCQFSQSWFYYAFRVGSSSRHLFGPHTLVSTLDLYFELSLSLCSMIRILNLSAVGIREGKHTETTWGTFSDSFPPPVVVKCSSRKGPMQLHLGLFCCGGTNKIIFFWYHWCYLSEVICIHLHYCRDFKKCIVLFETWYLINTSLSKYKTISVLFLLWLKCQLSAWFVNVFFWCVFFLLFSNWLALYFSPLSSFKNPKSHDSQFWENWKKYQTELPGVWTLGMAFKKAAEGDVTWSQSEEPSQNLLPLAHWHPV